MTTGIKRAPVKFNIVFDTHSVDLNRLLYVLADQGISINQLYGGSGPGGHHREGFDI